LCYPCINLVLRKYLDRVIVVPSLHASYAKLVLNRFFIFVTSGSQSLIYD